MAGKIYVTGDCHGDFRKFNMHRFPIQRELDKEDYVIICGDFGGIWNQGWESGNENYWLTWLDEKPYTTLFVDGNHENFDELYKYPIKEWHGGKVHEIRPHVLHLMRGEIFEICGKKILAFGGARSHDIQDGIIEWDEKGLWKYTASQWEREGKVFRINHYSWWEQELPNDEEIKKFKAELEKMAETDEELKKKLEELNKGEKELKDANVKIDETYLSEEEEKIKEEDEHGITL